MKWMPSRLRVASASVIQIDHGDSGVSRSCVIERLLASSKVGALAGSWCCTRLSISRAEKHGYQLAVVNRLMRVCERGEARRMRTSNDDNYLW
jgi:hypothetical protein